MMSFEVYYAELVRKNRRLAPSASEARQDFKLAAGLLAAVFGAR